MWARYIRAAVGFGAAMLLSSFLKVTMEPHIMDFLRDKLGQDHILVSSLSGVIVWLPFIVLFAIVLGIIAGGLTESRLPG